MSDDKAAEAQKLQHMVTRYIPPRDVLYKKLYSKLHYISCLRSNEAKMVMQEIHDNECGNHAGGRSLTYKAINYHWPKMFNDTNEYVQRCPQCQRFSPSSNRLSMDLHTLRSPWPLMQWVINMVGPLFRVQPQFWFFLVTTDYLVTWIEVVPLSEVTWQVMEFLWQKIVCS